MRIAGIAAMLFCGLPAPAAGPWKAVRIDPSRITFASPGTSQRFLVSGVDAAGQDVALEGAGKLTSSNPRVAQVDPQRGLVVAKTPGRAVIRFAAGRVSATATVEVRNQPADVAVHFSPDIISILTIKGCNGSNCHGSPAGQNGFKLSLFGYDLQADHEMIVKARDGRRVNVKNPEESLILKKPSFRVPHGGGRLLSPDSEEYRTILTWIRQGAAMDAGGVRLQRLELYPSERILVGAGARQQLAVIGRLSDGTTRDMTREVRYSVAAEAVASVTPDGLLTAASNGVTAVLARAMGQVAAAQIGVIPAPAGDDYPQVTGNNFIDQFVLSKLRRMNIAPYPLSSDREFVRRVYLDAIGTLPTIDEVRAFMADSHPDRRARLIDRLLEREEYAAFWTVKFEDWFRNNQLNSQGKSMGKFKEWLHDWIAFDRPYDQMVRQLLTSEGDTFQNPAANFWHPAADFMLKKFDVNKVTPTVGRLFLGIRLECAECHNHPLENYTQEDFYGLSAFFAKLRVKHGYGEYRRTWYLDDEGEVLHPVSKKPVPPKFLAAEAPLIPAQEDRRSVLAGWIASPHNPYFARATVNRIWHEYFDAGVVEPFDDFRSTNPPTNRELLDALASYFVDSGFRFKALHRVILNSRTYQASSVEPGGARQAGSLERLLFARYVPRKLPAEVLLDAISQVSAVPHGYRGYPKGTRAMDLYIPDAPDYFLVTFGFPRRDVLADRSKSPTMSQALHLMNGGTVLEKVEAQDNVLSALLRAGKSDGDAVAELYERAYARPPSKREEAAVLRYLSNQQAAGRERRRALEGVLWSLLNSKEFQLNH